ncbi:histidinol dehydrogenase [Euphorbia peplus]|nr:histidinol dehydrogenase [Euphorbia peplus]
MFHAEHNPDSQVVLVIVGDDVDLKAIETEITNSFTMRARDMAEAVSFSNLYAPEHLIINVKDAEKWESSIENAGSVFLG